MRRWWVWLAGAVVFLAGAAVVASFFIDEPLRRYLERQMNAHLQGYTVRIGALDFHPLMRARTARKTCSRSSMRRRPAG